MCVCECVGERECVYVCERERAIERERERERESKGKKQGQMNRERGDKARQTQQETTSHKV